MIPRGGFLIFVICLIFCGPLVAAQGGILEYGSRVDGTLLPNETHRFQLAVQELTLLSFHLAAVDNSLDPQLAIFDSDGRKVAGNDDYAYPAALDAVVRALVFPQADKYKVEVSGFGETSGAYRLDVLPGYDLLAEQFTTMSPAEWESLDSAAIVSQSDAGRLVVDLKGTATSALLLGKRFPRERDNYFEVEFDHLSSANEWQVGLVFRFSSADFHSRVWINKRGYWRLERVSAGDVTVLRDWNTHPSIVIDPDKLRLGVLTSGQHIDVIYGGQVVGTIDDAEMNREGRVGFALRTSDVLGSHLTFALNTAFMTVPTRVEDKLMLPEYIPFRNYNAMADVLVRQQLIPIGGEIRLTLPEGQARRLSGGVTSYVVAAGVHFAEFAMGAHVDLELGGDGNGGCGLLFHYSDKEHYQLAYVTADGEFGVSRRVGDQFEPGIYGRMSDADLEDHNLLLIVTGGKLHYYLDSNHVGSMIYQAAEGNVGIAVVNYARVDTNCAFKDLWVLSVDD